MVWRPLALSEQSRSKRGYAAPNRTRRAREKETTGTGVSRTFSQADLMLPHYPAKKSWLLRKAGSRARTDDLLITNQMLSIRRS